MAEKAREVKRDLLSELSGPSEQLAISMCHFADNGGKLDAIQAVAALGPKFQPALGELMKKQLIERGMVVGYHTETRRDPRTGEEFSGEVSDYDFQVDTPGVERKRIAGEDTDRFKLKAEVKKSILDLLFPKGQ